MKILLVSTMNHFLKHANTLIPTKSTWHFPKIGPQTDMIIFHFNARSLQKNIDKISHYISNLEKQPELIAISETKLTKRKIFNKIELTGYNFLHVNSNSWSRFVRKKSIAFTVLHEFNLNFSSVENLWVSLETRGKTKIIGVIYRHPDSAAEAINEFNEKLSDIMYQPTRKKHEFYVIGDINTDLMKINSNRHIKMFADSLIANNVKCARCNPSRITENSKTLIDHVYTNNVNEHVISGTALYS